MDASDIADRLDVSQLSLRSQAIAVTLGWHHAHGASAVELARMYGQPRAKVTRLLRELRDEIAALTGDAA